MNTSRPLTFWIVTVALAAMMVVLLRQVLLPFVTGMALAYLLDPLANRLERIGMKRSAATLLILGLFILGVITLLTIAIPVIGSEIAALIENLPAYIKRVQALVVDPSHPWLSKIVGVGLSEAQESSGELTSMGAGWLTDLLRSLWTDGRALISIFSLLVVTPIVTAYLVYDWNRIIVALDNAISPAQRNTVRALAREIDDRITGYLRGQGVICLILGAYWPHIRPDRICPVSWLAHRPIAVSERCNRAVWADLDTGSGRHRHLLCRPISRGLRAGTLSRRKQGAFEPCLADFCSVRLWVFVRSRRPLDRSAPRGVDRSACAIRVTSNGGDPPKR